ncbi:uncharacterized protein LOC105217363 isoform X2 [Zeugodacus cucurbitae]|uniref:uncharacterized protein LOC105217363 isoform X2 n=1 Tax=Zeugodacus cucurbitae TaxID=28588 RepID=UPI0023D95005|nr:uncharacterized protein LOC105217363 isoform X2 [Zeugodacus cucurbitae]
MSNANILAELKPCGYILATRQYKYFALKCIHCDKKYGHWDAFLQHLKQQHNDIEDEAHWLYECTEETLSPAREHSEENSLEYLAETLVAKEKEEPNSVFILDDKSDAIDVEDNLLNKNEIEANVFAEDTEDVVLSNRESSPTPTCCSSNDTLEDPHDQLSNNSVTVEELKILKISINLKIDSEVTALLITIYRNFPTLWLLDKNSTNTNKVKFREMLKSLTAHNIHISMDDLEESLTQLHLQYCDISSRLEEGIEISDIEEKYYEMCSFLKPYNKPHFVVNAEESDESESVHEENDKFIDDNDFNEGSPSGYGTSDGEAFQSKLIETQTLVRFSTRNKITSDFIQCLHEQHCLWNSQDPAYNDPKERLQAINKLKDYFYANYSIPLTEAKITTEIRRLYSFYKRCVVTRNTLNVNRKYYFERCAFLADSELDEMLAKRSYTHRKISFTTIDDFTLGFIDFCAMHPVLWNKNDPNYSVLNVRRQAYDEIAKNLQQIYNVELNNEEIYYAISRLKHHYYMLQRKQLLNGTLNNLEQEFLERCNFLPTSNNNLQCLICERILRSYTTLQTHLLKEHNIGELPHKCEYCEQRFERRALKVEHEVRAHTKKYEWFCSFCAKGFATRRDMEMHKLVHTGEHRSVCEHCGKGFRLKHQMTEHVKIMHERLKRFKCTMCPKDFFRKRQLDDHIRSHLNIRDKICDICGKGFTNIHGLLRHKQLHSDVKKYECNMCGKRFHRISGLSSHRKLKHHTTKQQQEHFSNIIISDEEEDDDGDANVNDFMKFSILESSL